VRAGKWVVAVAVAYIVAMTCGELVPLNAPRWEVSGIGVDKLAHAASYGVMTMLLYASFNGLGLIGSSLLALSHSIVIECVQTYLPRRSPDIHDLIAGVVGILFAVVILALLRRSAASKA